LLEFRIATVLVVPLNVIVDVPLANVVPVPLVAQLPETVHEPVVRVIVPDVALVIVTSDTVTVEAFAVNVPPVEIVKVPPPDSARLAVVRVPEIVVAVDTSIAVLMVIVPEIVRDANPLEASRVATVLVVPLIVTVDVPFVNTDPAPDVSQFPETVHDPDVSVIVPEVPPVIVTFPMVTVAWLPLMTPPLFTVSALEPNENVPELPAVSVRVPVTETAPDAVIVPVVMLNVVPLPMVIAPIVMPDAVPVMPPVPESVTAAPPVMLSPPVVRVPEPEVCRAFDTSIALFWVTVPETVRL
jgi:hypothetical protein